jgi:hypothetical protein
MTLSLRYTRKNFFGNSTYTEDYKAEFTKNDLIKSFLFFSKNQDAVIQIKNIIMFWKDSNDFEKKIVSVRVLENESVSGGIIPFEMMKKAWYGKFRKQAA